MLEDHKFQTCLSFLDNINGFSDITINKLFKGIVRNKKLLKFLFNHIKPIEYGKQITKASQSHTFVITGDLKNYSREEITNKLEMLGHKVTGSISKKTSYLITNDKTSGTVKNKKAQDLGIPIINEEEMIRTFLS